MLELLHDILSDELMEQTFTYLKRKAADDWHHRISKYNCRVNIKMTANCPFIIQYLKFFTIYIMVHLS